MTAVVSCTFSSGLVMCPSRDGPRPAGAAGLRSKPPGTCPGATTEDRRRHGRRRASSSGVLRTGPFWSAAYAEPLDEGAVARDVDLAQVLQQAAAPPDEQQQATTAVVVVLVHLQVLGEIADALGQQRDLRLGRAGVTLVGAVLGKDG